MTDWFDRRMVALDLETTSAIPDEARVVSASVVSVGGGEPTEAFTLLVNPGVEVPAEAAAIHGITTERALTGTPADAAVGLVLEALCEQLPAAMLVVFNARYDLTVMDREARRHGLATLTERTPFAVFDPFVVDKHLDRYRSGSRKLAAMCAHYGATLDGAHGAEADALAAARLAWRLGRSGQVIRKTRNQAEVDELRVLAAEWRQIRTDPVLLHAAQERWAADQARGLAEHFASKGEPKDVPVEWPVVPAAPEPSVPVVVEEAVA